MPAGRRPWRRTSSSAASIAAKVWPQPMWFLKVRRVMWKSRPSVSPTVLQSGPSLIARPSPASPSSTSRDPVTPSAASCAASTPASAARPACSGLDIESIRNACCRPAAKVAAVASAWPKGAPCSPSSPAVAAAAPKVPTVPVLCQCR